MRRKSHRSAGDILAKVRKLQLGLSLVRPLARRMIAERYGKRSYTWLCLNGHPSRLRCRSCQESRFTTTQD